MAAIICDIDDTLIRAGQYGIDKTIEWLKQRAGNYKIILVTGRPESTRKETVRVLRAAGVRYNRLVMNTGSTRESNKFKLEAGKALKASENVVLAIDNDAGARNSYRKAGIKTVSPSQLTDNMLKFTF
jgi:ribonucleotide monophosphatase NagD (HAD superfamily)